jgi:peptidoglycan/LPS O-acetylase OafA/YrhL
LVVLAAATLLVLASSLSPSEYFLSKGWRDYVLFNLALSNFSAPSLPGVFLSNSVAAVNGSLWTIKLEVAFYCLVPVIVWMVRRWGYLSVLSAICLLSIAWKIGFTVAAEHFHAEFLLKLGKQIPGQLAFFAGGAWGYYRGLLGNQRAVF